MAGLCNYHSDCRRCTPLAITCWRAGESPSPSAGPIPQLWRIYSSSFSSSDDSSSSDSFFSSFSSSSSSSYSSSSSSFSSSSFSFSSSSFSSYDNDDD